MGNTGWDVLKLALTFLFGGGGAWIVTLIRDRRRAARESALQAIEQPNKDTTAAIDITEQLRALARDAVREVREEIATVRGELNAERQKTARQGARITQLEKALHDNGMDVPPEVVAPTTPTL